MKRTRRTTRPDPLVPPARSRAAVGLRRASLKPIGRSKSIQGHQPFALQPKKSRRQTRGRTVEQEALRAFQNFESSRACCFRDAERQHLLGVLEAGFGTLGAFDATIRHIFKERRTSLSTRRASFDAGARVPLQERGVAAKQWKHSDGPVQV